ncbi:putative multidrug ABC transporter ATP-binding protein YbhF [subsurface metagenome]
MEDIPVIKTVNVTQKFGDFTAVNRLNFEIKENESIGIIGPNGAGKTTALNIITGYYFPTEGSVFFQGKDITHLTPQKRVQLGIMRTFQIVRVFNNLPDSHRSL